MQNHLKKMNKVITINLAGRLITIDEDASLQLNAYLKWLQDFFAREEGGLEIFRDMEDRIAELFEDKLRKSQASISKDDVQAVIAIMGRPEQIAMEHGDGTYEQEQVHVASASGHAGDSAETSGRYLRRNLADKVIGGVCSGVADYFKLDPVLVRTLMVIFTFMYGSGLFLYILLWIFVPGQYPSADELQLRRRWYRSVDQKVVGGVCAGLSYPLKVPKQVLRAIFAFPLLGIIFFNIINEYDMASFCTAALPTMTLIYLVLWMAMPKASTLTQKMELRGEPLDVQSLSSALRKEQRVAAEDGIRPRQSLLADIIKFMAYIVLAFVIFVVACVLIGLLVALIALLFGFSMVGIGFWPLNDLVFETPLQASLLYISAILLVAVPVMAIIRWLLRRVRRPVKRNKWVSYGLASLFFASLFTTIFIISDLASGFKYTHKAAAPLSLTQPTDTFMITQIAGGYEDVAHWDNDLIRLGNNGELEMRIASLKILPSESGQYAVELERQSSGRSPKQAAELASRINYHFEQDSNILKLPQFVSFGSGTLFRGQLATAKVYIPKGAVFKIGTLPQAYSKSWTISSRPVYTVKVKTEKWQNKGIYRMKEDGTVELIGRY